MNSFVSELTRNTVGFFLVIVGLAAMAFGAHIHTDMMIDAGKGLVSAALLAFQSKHAPDGNTTTTQVTVPPPTVASPK
jgi:hypothetical protein